MPSFTDDCGHHSKEARFVDLLLIIAIILLILWGGGFAFHVAGRLVHIVLVVALILFVLHFLRGGRGGV